MIIVIKRCNNNQKEYKFRETQELYIYFKIIKNNIILIKVYYLYIKNKIMKKILKKILKKYLLIKFY